MTCHPTPYYSLSLSIIPSSPSLSPNSQEEELKKEEVKEVLAHQDRFITSFLAKQVYTNHTCRPREFDT